MIKPEQVPQAAWLAMRDQMREGIRNEATLIAATLNAWPGMSQLQENDSASIREMAALILPLTEKTDDKA